MANRVGEGDGDDLGRNEGGRDDDGSGGADHAGDRSGAVDSFRNDGLPGDGGGDPGHGLPSGIAPWSSPPPPAPTTRRWPFGLLAVGVVALLAGLIWWADDPEVDDGRADAVPAGDRPITVTPVDGLAEWSPVTVSAEGFAVDRRVALTLCADLPDEEELIGDDCDRDWDIGLAADADGSVEATVAVPRLLTTGEGELVDCGERARSCRLVLYDEDDFARSGTAALTFATARAPEPAPVGPTLAATPSGPVPAGAPVALVATGFQPGEPLLVGRCIAEDRFEQSEQSYGDLALWERCEPLELSAAVDSILSREVGDVQQRAAADGPTLLTLDAAPAVDPYGAFLDRGDLLEAAGLDLDLGDTIEADSPEARKALAADTVGCTAAGPCTFVVVAAADLDRWAEVPYAIAAG